MERLALEQEVGHHGEDYQRDALLDDLELDQRERTAVALKADAVGRHLTTVFEESDAPREDDDADEWPVGAHARLLQFEMAIPGQCHEDVAAEEQQNGIEAVEVHAW